MVGGGRVVVVVVVVVVGAGALVVVRVVAGEAAGRSGKVSLAVASDEECDMAIPRRRPPLLIKLEYRMARQLRQGSRQCCSTFGQEFLYCKFRGSRFN